jgi:hypothetical protein
VADGERRLRVLVTDGAGNTAALFDQPILVRNAPHATGTVATVTVGVASPGESGHPGKGKGDEKGKGKGKGRSQALRLGECRSPRLKMRLARRPLWHTRPRHVPVLRFRQRYLFKGRLTCRAEGRRVPAPNGTPVKVFYRIWELTFKRHRGPVRKVRKGAIRVHKGGRLRVRLGFPTGRTIIFRYRRANALARSKLRVAVAPRGHLAPRWRR